MDLGPPTAVTHRSAPSLSARRPPRNAASSGAGLPCTLGGAGRLVFPPSPQPLTRGDETVRARRSAERRKGLGSGVEERGAAASLTAVRWFLVLSSEQTWTLSAGDRGQVT